MNKINNLLALGQINPIALDVQNNLLLIEKLINEAHSLNKKLLILPKNALLGEFMIDSARLYDFSGLINESFSKIQSKLNELIVLTSIAYDKDETFYLISSNKITTYKSNEYFELEGIKFFLNSKERLDDECFNVVLENIYFMDEKYLLDEVLFYLHRNSNTIFLSIHGLFDGQKIYTGLAFVSVDHEFSFFGKLFNFKQEALVQDCDDFALIKYKDNDYPLIIRALAFALFDYMEKSKSKGYALSLSGGADSALCACLVCASQLYALSDLGVDAYQKFLQSCGITITLDSKKSYAKLIVEDVMSHVLTTVYQGSSNSSDITYTAANNLSVAIGSFHKNVVIAPIVKDYTDMVSTSLGEELTWEKDDLTLQNIQARVRGPSIWMFANKQGKILLATGNLSEVTVGYCTMDGDTVGGVGPVAGIFKSKILKINKFLETHGLCAADGSKVDLSAISFVNNQAPTAELRPGGTQKDEDDLMPYPHLDLVASAFYAGRLTDFLMSIESKQERMYFYNCAKKMVRLFSRTQWKRYRYARGFIVSKYTNTPCLSVLTDGFKTVFEDLLKKI